MTDLVTRLGALADTPHPTPQIQRALREAAAALSLLLKERDETPAGIYAGQLRVRIDDLEEERDGLKAKLAESEDELDDCNRRALSYFDRAEKAEAKLAEAEKQKEVLLDNIQRQVYLTDEARAEAAALREAAHVAVKWVHQGDVSTVNAVARLSEALSQPGPGAAYQERMRKLKAVVEAVKRIPFAQRGAKLNNAMARLAALEEKP